MSDVNVSNLGKAAIPSQPGAGATTPAAERRRVIRRTPLIPLWAWVLGALVVALIGSYPYYGTNQYVLSLLGKFLCYSIFALSVDLIWGFAGILSLGQAVYFGFGAYFVALSLKINYALIHPTRYGGRIPDFMEWNGLTALPKFMEPLISVPFAVVCALAIPTLLAFLFGVITFKRHIYGVYCAVITLAESLILQDFIIEYQAYTGGFNGITDYSNYVGAPFLWFILAVTVAFYIGARALTHSRVGTILKSIRDNDVRAEFMGYNVANYRIFVFCVSAFMAASAGAMYAAWVGIISFLDTGPVFSIEAVIWTAVGGRGTLIGSFVGAFLVKGAEFLLSGVLASFWQLIMAAIFILVVLVFRDGIVGSIANLLRGRRLGSFRQIVEDSDRTAADRQQEWRPEGAARSGEDPV
jgi:urea transport system permease protein